MIAPTVQVVSRAVRKSMSVEVTLRLSRVGQEAQVAVQAKRTTNGNLSFEYSRTSHILNADGKILQRVTFAMGHGRWERSPVLVLSPEVVIADLFETQSVEPEAGSVSPLGKPLTP